jgi:hypothetical protein
VINWEKRGKMSRVKSIRKRLSDSVSEVGRFFATGKSCRRTALLPSEF